MTTRLDAALPATVVARGQTAPAIPERTARHCRFLMCPPTHFTLDYAINPWMQPTAEVDVDRALAQWTALHDTYVGLGHEVVLIDPVPGLPDMVFAANGGVVLGGRALGARFRHTQRTAEGPAYLSWLQRAGLAEVRAPEAVTEGEGDFVVTERVILAGTGFRTDHAAHLEAQELFGRPVVSLRLIDPRFYHLDTALFALGDDADNVAYYPEAFSPASREVLRLLYPDAVIVAATDAAVLGLNAVSDGRHVILPTEAVDLAMQLAERGFVPVPVDLSELRKAGGGPKCCTLEIRL